MGVFYLTQQDWQRFEKMPWLVSRDSEEDMLTFTLPVVVITCDGGLKRDVLAD